MPNFNPANAYQDRVLSKQDLGPDGTLGKGSYWGLYDRVSAHLSSQTADQQFEMDTAMWYGAITHPGTAWKADMLRRLFKVLYVGGLMVKRDVSGVWRTWAGQRQPICASISHGARVLICLPENDNVGNFWAWLWGVGNQPETRGAATHGIKPAEATLDIYSPNGVMKGIVETKGDNNVDHFGINIALGGNGRMNPISGKMISENGKHGHLYIAYYTQIKHRFKTNENVARKAILVNCEQSAPWDRQVAVKGKAGKAKTLPSLIGSVIRISDGVPDQYGGGHGVGGHSRFAATGGDDFSYGNKTTQLGAYGPARNCYYDGMYIDLSADRFERVKAFEWEDAMLGQAGLPPIPPVRRRGVVLTNR